ncbi:DMT family transporter [Nodosilinea sp. E11]|uniref:DMT family transporter n=1 Tax=Nodosilinea sp. E11 TaxID=3037479 RepID=UPI00293420CB|nr:DMT family transporter [Nodosilinea sp. E11]WOD39675.1 DMT family transporter [Nodosilinea sp. E11]
MTSFVLFGLAALLGTGSSFSAAINGLIGREIGLLKATFLFLSLGTAFSALLVYGLEDQLGLADLASIFTHRPYLLTPGLINSVFIIIIIRATAIVGTTLTTACLFSGQMLISLWLDHVGFAGLRVIAMTPARIAAVGVLLVGVTLLSLSRQPSGSSGASGHAPSVPEKALRKPGNLYAILAVLMVGGLLSAANSLNAALGKAAGVFTATLFFLGPGVLLLPIFSIVLTPSGQNLSLKSWRPIYFIPGILNVVSIAGSVFLIPIIGVQAMVSTVFTAKVFTGLFLDGFGWFGLPRSPITGLRLMAALMLSLGVFLSSF